MDVSRMPDPKWDWDMTLKIIKMCERTIAFAQDEKPKIEGSVYFVNLLKPRAYLANLVHHHVVRRNPRPSFHT